MWWNRKKDDDELVELNRQHAALVNNHVHFDLKNMSEVERNTAIADTLEKIEAEQNYRRFPWNKKLKKIQKKMGK